MSRDPTDFDYPDLVIEIDLSTPQVDRPSIYKELGAREAWWLMRGQELVIEQLQADGSYAPADQTRFLRVRPKNSGLAERRCHGAPGRLAPPPEQIGAGIRPPGVTRYVNRILM
jgi:hypothetical protein